MAVPLLSPLSLARAPRWRVPRWLRRAAGAHRTVRRHASSAVPLHGLRFRHTADGSAPRAPAVILHGLMGTCSNWRPIADDADAMARRDSIALDLRNHGRSPHVSDMNIVSMAGDVAEAIPGRAALIGHSMGGKVAMHLALTRPELVERLVVVDVAPLDYAARNAESWRIVQVMVNAMAGLDTSSIDSRADADARLKSAGVRLPGVRRYALQNLIRGARRGPGGERVGSPGVWRWECNIHAIKASLSELSGFPAPPGASYGGPATFIRGSDSPYVAEADYGEIFRLFPAAKVKTIPDAGHWLHMDQPSMFKKALGEALACE